MTRNHLVVTAEDADWTVPAELQAASDGFRRWAAIDEHSPSVHMRFSLCELEPGGAVGWHVRSFEESFYVVAGQVVCDTDDGAQLLGPGDYGVVGVGAPHAWRNVGDAPVRWAEMTAPQPRAAVQHTFAVADRPRGEPTAIDVRDPRTRSFGHVSPENMEVDKQTQDRLAVSASMRTALLVYSGITVKMMVDSDLGADLQTMFMVQYVPGGFAGAHDHPLEEAYMIVEGEVDAVFDGERYRMHVGDIALAGVGCVHEFANPADVPVRWLETQAPQPPSRHSYRFARDWSYLADALGASADDTGGQG
jgi:mannose-6-phosphate isomerase-like protein (cupin superfamily)